MARVDAMGKARDGRLRVLDRLRLVEDRSVEFMRKQHLVVTGQQRIGGDHEIAIRDSCKRFPAIQTPKRQDRKRGREVLRLAQPVGENTGGTNNQRRLCLLYTSRCV